jgi:hypothetical protein
MRRCFAAATALTGFAAQARTTLARTTLARTTLALLTLALPAAAQTAIRPFDLTGDTDRLLGDPAFLPLRGQLEGSASETYNVDHYNYEPGNTLGDPFYYDYHESAHITGNDIAGALAYGITDDLTLGASLGWENRFTSSAYSYEAFQFGSCPGLLFFCQRKVSGIDKFHRIGSDNPDFSLTWRAVDQRAAPVNFDVSASYAPDLLTARDGNAFGTTGTHAAGGQAAGLRGAVSREMRALTVLAYGEFDYHGRQDILQPAGGGVLHDAPHPSYQAGVQLQIRVLPVVALNTGFNYAWSAHFHSQVGYGDDDIPVRTLNESAGTISPYAGLLFPIWGRRLVGELAYQHDFVGTAKSVTPNIVPALFTTTSPSETNKYVNQDDDLYTARIRFLFF